MTIFDLLPTLSSYTYLSRELKYSPIFLRNEIKKFPHDNKVIYPCFFIELRDVLNKNSICSPNNVTLFSLRFAEKYLNKYPIFLLLDLKSLSVSSIDFISIVHFNENSIGIKNSVLKLLLNMPAARGLEKRMKNFVKEVGFEGEVLFHNNIPGISSKYASSNKFSQQNISLPLTSQEKSIFNLLRDIKKKVGIDVQMRVAGGWVRDRLLGKISDDIDIAIDMPGYQFAKLVYDAAISQGLSYIKEPHKVSLEKSADPAEKEPSDDLMVGGIYIYGQKIEFVPMRTEHYPDINSRIPAIINTRDPRDDSKRRDLTVNALYYNIDTGKVEDYVGGLGDLGLGNNKRMILRTPVDPAETFQEDPLRVLRVLRFYSRYGNSQIDPDVIEAMQLPEVKEAYKRKVAPERAGPEIIKMLQGEKPADAVRVLFETDFYKQAFDVPELGDLHEEGIQMDQRTEHHKYNLMEHTLRVVENLDNIMREQGESDEMRGLLNLSGVLHDFGKMKKGIQQPHPKGTGNMQYFGHEDESALISESVMKSIGIGKKEREIVNKIISLHMEPYSAKDWSDKAKGRFLRRTTLPGKEEESRDLWKYIFYHAQADEMATDPDTYDKEKRKSVFDAFNEYINSPKGQIGEVVVNGYDIMGLIPELKPETGFINEITKRIQEMQDSGEIDISYIQLPEGPDKNGLREQAKSIGKQKVLEMKPEILQKYQKRAKNMNWFKKTAQSVIDSHINPIEDETGIKKGPCLSNLPFYEGMKVRDRREGIALPQSFGIIKKIDGEKLEVEWFKSKTKPKKQVFRTDDTVALYKILAEI